MSNFAYLFTPLSVTLSTFQDHSCMPNWRDVMVMPCSDLLLKWLHSHSMMWMSCLTEVCCWSGYVHTAWCGCHAWLKSAAEVATFTQHDADVMPDWSLLLKWLRSHSMMRMSCLTEVATFTQHGVDVMPDWSLFLTKCSPCHCHQSLAEKGN